MMNEDGYKTILQEAPFGFIMIKANEKFDSISKYEVKEINNKFYEIVNSNINEFSRLIENSEVKKILNICFDNLNKESDVSNYRVLNYFSLFLKSWYKVEIQRIGGNYYSIYLYDITTEVSNIEEYKSLVSSLNDIVFELDMDFKFTDVWTADSSKLYIPSHAFIGKSVEDVFEKELSERFVHVFKRAVETGKRETMEYMLGMPDGDKWYEVNIFVKESINGSKSIICVVNEINERKRAEELFKKSEERFRLIFEKAATPMLLIENGTFVQYNRAALSFLGFDSAAELIGKHPAELSPVYQPDGRSSVEKADEVIEIAKEQGFHRFEWVHIGAGNREYNFDVMLTSLEAAGQNMLLCVWYDVTERKVYEQNLRESEERYRSLIQTMQEGLALHQILYNEDGKPYDYLLLDVNPAFYKHTNITEEVPKGISACRMYGTDIPPYLSEYEEVARTGIPYSFFTYYEQMKKHFRISVFSPKTGYFATVFEDITEQKKKEAEIIHLSFHDKLTGLYNRAFFEEEMRRLDAANQLPISIIIGDVNGLKITNDVFGHLEGDNLLKSISKIMKANCRNEDVVARWGGDEFIIILPETNERRANEICKKISKACKEAGTLKVQLSISLGHATKCNAEEDIVNVIKSAEDWMYRHKLLESKSFRSSVLTSLKKTLFERSHETEEHADRMAYLCTKMGVKLGFADNELDDLKLLGVLHDIGKIAIKDSILSKPGKLNEEEWEEMKRHSEIGYRIAQSTPELAQLAECILAHHERWDGSGYPQGLSGRAIPLMARIVSIADAYDVMTNKRVYKDAVTHEEAIFELLRCSGTQFDPGLVGVFCSIWNE